MSVTNIIISGTGGQGIVLASRIIAETAFRSGFDVKESEIHGMAQRGGSVVGHIRFGNKVFSPHIPYQSGDIMVALEEVEAIRYLSFLKPEGIIILNKKKIPPAGKDLNSYPKNIESFLTQNGFRVLSVDAEAKAKELGNIKVENSVILGILSIFLPFSEDLWIEVIRNSVPSKTIDLNINAFKEGRRLAEKNVILEQGNRNIRKKKVTRTSI
jgi:indolepyruvate ferredoxin oxidoreductase beta subunit